MYYLHTNSISGSSMTASFWFSFCISTPRVAPVHISGTCALLKDPFRNRRVNHVYPWNAYLPQTFFVFLSFLVLYGFARWREGGGASGLYNLLLASSIGWTLNMLKALHVVAIEWHRSLISQSGAPQDSWANSCGFPSCVLLRRCFAQVLPGVVNIVGFTYKCNHKWLLSCGMWFCVCFWYIPDTKMKYIDRAFVAKSAKKWLDK